MEANRVFSRKGKSPSQTAPAALKRRSYHVATSRHVPKGFLLSSFCGSQFARIDTMPLAEQFRAATFGKSEQEKQGGSGYLY